MIVVKEEEPAGVIRSITFRAEDENPEALKAAVKIWIQNNYPQMDWEEFVNRLMLLDNGRIRISMI